MSLSRRTTWAEHKSPLARALARVRAEGRTLHDLTLGNPTRAGLLHPDAVYRLMGDPRSAVYEPHALGLPRAREAVAAYYDERGIAIAADRIWLCASTSEAYAQLFALLCDPSDAVLVPRPGYPLLDVLGDVMGVRRVAYPLVYDGRWHIDLSALRRILRAESGIRAVVAVAPNNPTGNYLSRPELAALESLCVDHGLCLVIDAVFADYPLREDPNRVLHVMPEQPQWRCPCFVLSGLSKVAALPQLKLAWVAVLGTPEQRRAVFERIEQVADAFLSVATPVQLALPGLLAAARPMQARILARLRENLDFVRQRTVGHAIDVLDTEGGWTVLLRLPHIGGLDDFGWAVLLLEKAGVLVHPGSLFDVPAPPRVAVSLLVQPKRFATAIECLIDVVSGRINEDHSGGAAPP